MNDYRSSARAIFAALFMALVTACSGSHAVPPTIPHAAVPPKSGQLSPQTVDGGTPKNPSALTKYLSVSPDYLYLGNPSPGQFTVLATNAGVLSATSDNPSVATVSPASQPSKSTSGKQTQKFTAVFTVKPISSGVANVTVKDAVGNTAVGIAVVLSRAFVGTWTVKEPMPTGRYYLGAAPINGILYAVGGFQYDPYMGFEIPQAALEAYNPQTGEWTKKKPMPDARGNVAVGAVNGILYAVGGSSGGPGLTAVEAYDPETDSWTSKASLPSPRVAAGAAVVNGILYVVGGDADVLAYDPQKDKWKTLAAMPEPVVYPSVAVVNNDVYVFGGMNSDGMTTWTVRVYHTATNTWTAIPDGFPYGNYYYAAGTINGICYSIGGGAGSLSGAARYFPSTNTSEEIAGMTVGQTGLAAAVIDNRLYAVGGSSGEAFGATYNTLQVYTPPI